MNQKSKFKIGDLVKVKNIPNEVWKVDIIHYGAVNCYTIINIKTNLPYFCAEFEIEPANSERKQFKPGDVVTVDGYVGEFEVIECTGYEPIVEDTLYKLININTGEEVFGAECDMKLSDKQKPPRQKKGMQPKKTPKHRTFEAGILVKLEYNRFLVEKGKRWIDAYLDLYTYTKDEKYLRRIKRISNFINKIPVRAYQID